MNRIERYSLLAASTAISLFALASPVAATVIEYESQAGATSPTDGRPLGATATFTYDATCLTNCELTIELANTEPMTGISQALTDFHFTSTSITGKSDSQAFLPRTNSENAFHSSAIALSGISAA